VRYSVTVFGELMVIPCLCYVCPGFGETMSPQSSEHTTIKEKPEHCYICHGVIHIATDT